mmetsp:Transcript_14378/g.18839  ORF Transcript_14378/g.18839 Transcript_14378/m.18839 type:complete len:85 (-) Transcript_14378:1590-1844(-)
MEIMSYKCTVGYNTRWEKHTQEESSHNYNKLFSRGENFSVLPCQLVPAQADKQSFWLAPQQWRSLSRQGLLHNEPSFEHCLLSA